MTECMLKGLMPDGDFQAQNKLHARTQISKLTHGMTGKGVTKERRKNYNVKEFMLRYS